MLWPIFPRSFGGRATDLRRWLAAVDVATNVDLREGTAARLDAPIGIAEVGG
jgi:hypothetical protein